MSSESQQHEPADGGPPLDRHAVTDPKELSTILGEAPEFVRNKLGDRLDDPTRAFIALSPLVFVATGDGDGRLDVSPKGDAPGFVHTVDTNTLLIPSSFTYWKSVIRCADQTLSRSCDTPK